MRGQALGSRTVKITWKPPPEEQQNGEVLGYRVLYAQADTGYGPNEAQEINVLADDRSSTISDLDKWTQYKVWVSAYTSVGDGPRSAVIYVETDEDGMCDTRCSLWPGTTYIMGSFSFICKTSFFS